MKILILLSYYNRPLLLKNTLYSLLESNKHYSDWELFFYDDNSVIPGEPIASQILRDHLKKITFQRSERTVEDKVKNGLLLGKVANDMMSKSNAEIVITLADDDELVPTYLRDLVIYFNAHPEVMYCYSKVYVFNPLKPNTFRENLNGFYNQWGDLPINPVNRVDSSQVAFRMSCFKDHGIRYPETSRGELPYTVNFDAVLFQQLYDKFGEAQPTGLIGQYKGIHDYQLVWNKKKGESELARFMKKVGELSGKEF